MNTIEDIKAVAGVHGSFLMHVNLQQTEDGDVLMVGDAGEEVREMRRIVSDHNKAVRTGKVKDRQYRIALQGRLGQNSKFKDVYAGSSRITRIKLIHAQYAGVYIWERSL